MSDWAHLRGEFEALQAMLHRHRIDYQWGVAGTYCRLTGGGTSHATRQFQVLSKIAGQKLLELPAGTISQDVLDVVEPISRWYETLRYYSGAFEFNFVAKQTGADGADHGNIYTGTLNLPAETSALVCLQFANLPVIKPTDAAKGGRSLSARMNGFLKKEAELRGYFWIVIGFMVMAILAALAL